MVERIHTVFIINVSLQGYFNPGLVQNFLISTSYSWPVNIHSINILNSDQEVIFITLQHILEKKLGNI